jgi:hypothetical protein
VGYIHGKSVIVYKTSQKSQLILKDLFIDLLYRDYLELYILTFLLIIYTTSILLRPQIDKLNYTQSFFKLNEQNSTTLQRYLNCLLWINVQLNGCAADRTISKKKVLNVIFTEDFYLTKFINFSPPQIMYLEQ